VLHDVIEKWETPQRAREIYGVAFSGSLDDESLAVDVTATAELRAGRTVEPARA
jgi:N-methylhydantoinase B